MLATLLGAASLTPRRIGLFRFIQSIYEPLSLCISPLACRWSPALECKPLRSESTVLPARQPVPEQDNSHGVLPRNPTPSFGLAFKGWYRWLFGPGIDIGLTPQGAVASLCFALEETEKFVHSETSSSESHPWQGHAARCHLLYLMVQGWSMLPLLVLHISHKHSGHSSEDNGKSYMPPDFPGSFRGLTDLRGSLMDGGGGYDPCPGTGHQRSM